MEAAVFVPAHAPAAGDMKELAAYNRTKVLAVGERLLSLCQRPVTFEEALAELFCQYQLTMNFEQYVLVGSTVRSFLSWLKDRGELEVRFVENRLLWAAAQ
ncbi:hypothetical protein SDC9_140344 [bioreactor metagenome]|uniref:Uncharacterized protein n=1 Tax=bioreactor metagenome TaxID=1076179 RepID=A0A645DVR0_9ZZZZ